MDSFKVKINFKNRFVIKHIVANGEVDACWEAKSLADSMNAVSFDLMYSE